MAQVLYLACKEEDTRRRQVIHWRENKAEAQAL